MLHPDLTFGPLFATIIYASTGVLLMIIFVVLFDKLFKLNLHQELVKDQNVAFGVLLAGVSIGISIIIAAAIGS
jgi:putative membrane protein